ncbi:HlyD family efflux transporter periplasmic adaptor subunit [Rhodanobacter sp. DHB23]|uniref:efflux RND transporter periplasmic adaptor subunit n=1 Tax=Rhodanobacter sp. DHB23 TaxID=2775923 RepID=UPI00178411C2|nr:HlyD family efflux transporter periplasmic adaptor subunit [Rhodanobacter sp. DHB23]MBD8872016.1 HlyD family efflux transporter periplasmic adaptor subunit [Rhodanobacter sp. DHB23]
MTPTALRPPSPLRLAGCALAAALALAACSKSAQPAATSAAASQYAAVARGRVDIEGGLLALTMPREGVLASVAVHEGDTVKQGQLLAALDTRPAQLAVDSAQAQLEQAQAQLKLLAVKQAAARLRAQRLGAAATAGAGDGQSADDAREASSQLDAEHDADQAAADMAAQKLAEAKYELAQRSLRAPFDASVVHVTAQPGASVSPSDALFTLLPDKPRIVRAELNESFVGAVHPGMRAEVADNDDSGNDRWSAHVLRIGQVYGPATLENDPQTRANARTVECVLAFDQPEQQLRIGQRVIVRFVPDDRH